MSNKQYQTRHHVTFPGIGGYRVSALSCVITDCPDCKDLLDIHVYNGYDGSSGLTIPRDDAVVLYKNIREVLIEMGCTEEDLK